MILAKPEIQRAEERAKAAFPHFTDWKYHNEINDDYCGFSLWGQFVLVDHDAMSRYFFVTLDTYDDRWRGHLTIGKHSYFWSSTEEGDAHLLDTEPTSTLEDAIVALKTEIADLFRSFSAV